jgi:glucose-1-phosphate adenylyltransferase
MGIFRFDRQGRIEGFEEKPNLARLHEMGGSVPEGAPADLVPPPDMPFVASMGIYVFSRQVLIEVLEQDRTVDFGREIIPHALERRAVRAYFHRGYWADVGTVRSFYDSNIGLTRPGAPFSFYHATRPVFTRPRFLPPSWVDGGTLSRSIVAEGASLCQSHIEDSVVGLRMQVRAGARVRRSVLLGADHYEAAPPTDGRPAMGIGHDCLLDGVIVDKNARIGDGVRLVNEQGVEEADGPGYVIRDGVIVVPKDSVVPPGTTL